MFIEAIKKDTLDLIKNNLPTVIGIKNSLICKGLPIRTIEDYIEKLIGQPFYIEEFNGTDMDWSSDIEIGGKGYSIWVKEYHPLIQLSQ